MIVITLSKTPASLRGDLTKWCQEIQTGIYVGNVNAKVRDLLWDRVQKNIGQGEATLVYNTNNELGYTFRTTRADRKVVDYDGIPFLKHTNNVSTVDLGFSKAAKYHKAKINNKISSHTKVTDSTLLKFAVIDIETTGLDPKHGEILSIAAVKYSKNGKLDLFYKLIKDVTSIPDSVAKVTGLNLQLLRSEGSSLNTVLPALKKFLGDRILVGYNLSFDINFLETAYRRNNISELINTSKDLLPIVKRSNKFLDDYKLGTVLKAYGLENPKPHHANSDAKSTYQLAVNLIGKGKLKL